MIFLDTRDTMKFVEHDDYTSVTLNIEDYMLDLPLSDFTNLIHDKVNRFYFDFNTPTLFSVVCNDIAKEDVEYIIPFLMELITESIGLEKVNKNWQPKASISDKLELNMKAQTNLLNYKTNPNILTIHVLRNNEKVYEMIRKEN